MVTRCSNLHADGNDDMGSVSSAVAACVHPSVIKWPGLLMWSWLRFSGGWIVYVDSWTWYFRVTWISDFFDISGMQHLTQILHKNYNLVWFCKSIVPNVGQALNIVRGLTHIGSQDKSAWLWWLTGEKNKQKHISATQRYVISDFHLILALFI